MGFLHEPDPDWADIHYEEKQKMRRESEEMMERGEVMYDLAGNPVDPWEDSEEDEQEELEEQRDEGDKERKAEADEKVEQVQVEESQESKVGKFQL
jgi:hypothetical protein